MRTQKGVYSFLRKQECAPYREYIFLTTTQICHQVNFLYFIEDLHPEYLFADLITETSFHAYWFIYTPECVDSSQLKLFAL